MMKKLLIANRGEIACRVMRTAHRLGIATVAVYSEADAEAPHVRMADEAVLLGPAPARESYLKADLILKAAKDTGADAIHPGYGFLSENAEFARACAKAGVTFVGPSAEAIEAMGLKDRAKKLMEEAGVPVVPGYHGDTQDAGFLAEQAESIGYPVLIKAVAGGGGKGMRLVEDPKDFNDALASAQGEATTSFGNPAVLIEKYIQKPRHIEVQVFGDGTSAVHLFERDCSL
ncbi:MAG TPA: methylcrotonoyl-CoA carboxylase, partial [Oceanicaulis sp.]|nr:methylcrotonoyl-CoA carboxylase [Oceanicaulis sp.]